MDTSETVSGKRERAPAAGVMDSETPTQSMGPQCRAGDLHLASVEDKEVAEGCAQWWHLEMKENIGAQSREGPGASFVLDSGAPAVPAWVAEEHKRVLRQEMTAEEEGPHAYFAMKAKGRELGARKQFKWALRPRMWLTLAAF